MLCQTNKKWVAALTIVPSSSSAILIVQEAQQSGLATTILRCAKIVPFFTIVQPTIHVLLWSSLLGLLLGLFVFVVPASSFRMLLRILRVPWPFLSCLLLAPLLHYIFCGWRHTVFNLFFLVGKSTWLTVYMWFHDLSLLSIYYCERDSNFR